MSEKSTFEPSCGMWCIQGTVTTMTENGGEVSPQFPTFYLHPEVQGCNSMESAVRVATSILNPTKDGNIMPNVSACLVDTTSVVANEWTNEELQAMDPHVFDAL